MKKSKSLYNADARSKNWLKVINYQYEPVYFTGIRKNEFGVLLSFENGSPAGLMEFMKPADRMELYSRYRDHISGQNDNYFFLRPKIKGLVKYRNLTKAGKLRIPSFEHWID